MIWRLLIIVLLGLLAYYLVNEGWDIARTFIRTTFAWMFP